MAKRAGGAGAQGGERPESSDGTARAYMGLGRAIRGRAVEMGGGGIYTVCMTGGPFLIVDDSLVARLSLKSFLKAEGAEIVEAGSGEAALDLLAAGLDPSLVFLDLTMPGIGGIATLRVIRSRKPELKVVVVTADIQAFSLDEVRAAGAFAIVRKPTTKGEIAAVVAKARGEPESP